MTDLIPETVVDLDALTDGTGFVAVGGSREGDGTGEHAAVLCRTSRVEVREHGDFWLSPTPDRPSTGWDAPTYRRLCTWVRLRDRADGLERELVLLAERAEGRARWARNAGKKGSPCPI